MNPAQNRRRDDAMAVGQLVTLRRHQSIRRRIRKSRSQTAVRAPAVVVAGPLPKNGAQVTLGHRDHAVQTLTTDCADYALAMGIRLWNANRRFENFQTHRCEGSIDAVRVNRVSIVDHESVPLVAPVRSSETAAPSIDQPFDLPIAPARPADPPNGASRPIWFPLFSRCSPCSRAVI